MVEGRCHRECKVVGGGKKGHLGGGCFLEVRNLWCRVTTKEEKGGGGNRERVR